ncbi:S-adenosyl-L-methionine-dependent methyltransferase [Penicillium verhagenii]|nr:S-adenosyl-L-methionine-dependent methyltransferase [Penicillium verhagenii]
MHSDTIDIDPDFYTMEKAYGEDDWKSDTTSLASEVARGRVSNGRRYQSLKSEDYWSPSDELQFEAYETGNNPLHRAPITPKHVLDVGTGKGSWAIDMADMYPNATVRGVDLYPPPDTWIPPNCVFEVDDLLQPWTWSEKFDLIYLRHMLGSFDWDGWATLYNNCYENLEPGGWIEQFEFNIQVFSDDKSLPQDTILSQWADIWHPVSERAGRPFQVQDKMRSSLEKAGFVEIQEKVYKVPVGPWARDPVLKELGLLHNQHWATGLEGRRIWARKPREDEIRKQAFDTPIKREPSP